MALGCRRSITAKRQHRLSLLAVAALTFRAAWMARKPRVRAGASNQACMAMQFRRTATFGLGSLCVGSCLETKSTAAEPGRIKRFRRVIAEDGLENWKLRDYEAMRDDAPRTSGFDAAIRRRLADEQGRAVVVDIGTGPFALLAVSAARAGARRVYAIEKNPEAAALAKKTVTELGLQDTIQVIEGDSMKVKLPERVDLVVSELIGSIATQEGVEPIIRDAAARMLKENLGGRSGMIPARCQTCIAPIAYRPDFWGRIINFRTKGLKSRGVPMEGTELPLRIDASKADSTFSLLAAPQVIEDFYYGGGVSAGEAPRQEERSLSFKVTAEIPESQRVFSGFAMWTRVVVDESTVLDVRGQPDSHWAYVVALMSKETTRLTVPSEVHLRSVVDYTARPVRYTLDADVLAI